MSEEPRRWRVIKVGAWSSIPSRQTVTLEPVNRGGEILKVGDELIEEQGTTEDRDSGTGD